VGAGRFTKSSVPLDIPHVLSYAGQAHFDVKSSHNSYLDFIAESGLLGAIPYAILLIILTWRGGIAAFQKTRKKPFLVPGCVFELCADEHSHVGNRVTHQFCQLDGLRFGGGSDCRLEQKRAFTVRLGFHYHVPACEKDGKIWMPGYLGRFVDSLAEYCETLVCLLHSPRSDEMKLMDYPLQSKNVKLIHLGEHSSLPQRLLHLKQTRKIVKNSRDLMDVLLVRGPTPLLPWISRSIQPIPTVLLLVGDQLAGIDDLPQPGWRREAIRLFWQWNNHQQLLIQPKA